MEKNVWWSGFEDEESLTVLQISIHNLQFAGPKYAKTNLEEPSRYLASFYRQLPLGFIIF